MQNSGVKEQKMGGLSSLGPIAPLVIYFFRQFS